MKLFRHSTVWRGIVALASIVIVALGLASDRVDPMKDIIQEAEMRGMVGGATCYLPNNIPFGCDTGCWSFVFTSTRIEEMYDQTVQTSSSGYLDVTPIADADIICRSYTYIGPGCVLGPVSQSDRMNEDWLFDGTCSNPS